MKHSQADLYLETYQVLDLEMSRLREIQRWQSSASAKVRCISFLFRLFSSKIMCLYTLTSLQLAADMQRFSRPERRINGPTVTHLWWVITSLLPSVYIFRHLHTQCVYNLTLILLNIGQCWSCLMSWFSLTILKMLKLAFLMISLGIKGKHFIRSLHSRFR